MATMKGSQRERIEALKKKLTQDYDSTMRELDHILLDQTAGGIREPEPQGGGGPGPGDTGP